MRFGPFFALKFFALKPIGYCKLDQSHGPHTAMAIRADDDVIVNGNPQWTRRFDDLPSHRDVLFAGLRRPAGMIVHQNEAGAPKLHGLFDDFARVDRGLINRAVSHMLVANEHVARIEMQHSHAFHGQMRHISAQIVQERLPAREHWPTRRLFLQHAECRRLHGLESGDAGLTKPVHGAQCVPVRRQDASHGAKLRDQAFSERLCIAAWNGEGEKIFDEFMVQKRLGPTVCQPLSQSRPVPVPLCCLCFNHALALAPRFDHGSGS